MTFVATAVLEVRRVHEVLLHVRRVRVEQQRTGGRVAEHDEQRARMRDQAAHRAGVLVRARPRRRRLDERAANVERDDRRQRADRRTGRAIPTP